MICKDCINEEVCAEVCAEVDDAIAYCIDFKDKAQFMEVVRCKDCVFNVANMEKDPLDATDYSDITCSYFMTDGMTGNDFCSYGKKVE